jgi:hypothetical protein
MTHLTKLLGQVRIYPPSCSMGSMKKIQIHYCSAVSGTLLSRHRKEEHKKTQKGLESKYTTISTNKKLPLNSGISAYSTGI